MITIISSTNRANSYTILIAEYYQALLEKLGVESKIVDLTRLPEKFIFSALYENVGKDEEYNRVVEDLRGSEKFVFIIPEYNGSFPGVLKAFLDGLDYPSPFRCKKGALVGIGSGNMAGTLGLSHMTDILNYLGMNVLAIKPRLPKIEKIFAEGKINDKFLTELLETQAKELLRF